jgi:hypothetical protein
MNENDTTFTEIVKDEDFAAYRRNVKKLGAVIARSAPVYGGFAVTVRVPASL